MTMIEINSYLNKPRFFFTTFAWMLVLYLPGLLLSLFVAFFATTLWQVDDLQHWLGDGDIVAVLGIALALVTLPVVYWATQKTPVTNKLTLLGLEQNLHFSQLARWALITLAFIACWWAINTLLAIDTPLFMLHLKATTDHIWLLLLAICLVAPLFEEVVFRGFMFGRLQYSVAGKWGAVLLTSVVFTLIHGQYNTLELTMVFSLAILLGYARLKTGNLYVPIAIHMLNNTVSMISLYWFDFT
ncbi:CPBP family intramembrane glutamic endopeptidase [Thalassotalea mangrovi]|uniref:CPBP family intramembrane metalloprotease n=1 Tax=Thalassotalea mangrovi TaxID=2572245 RepID=A0A4U1B321_9GAMM|nr:type II CAAX endopeptidase family protein [Thalassotalea mangrovi]TKB44002.1 CPBP family intramembrane metalloprotease [Thalassotalea mangrovi]